MTISEQDKRHEQNLTATSTDGVMCGLDGVWVHSIPAYLKHEYPDMTVEEYLRQFEGDELYSPKLKQARDRRKENTMNAATVIKLPVTANMHPPRKEEFAKVFDLGSAKAALNKRGQPIMIDVMGDPDPDLEMWMPEIDNNYVYNIDLLKNVMMAFHLNKPMLCWGKHGTGKTTIFLQFCARTRRPAIRVQHTISTEEAHILGQYVVKNSSTEFEPGPLALAMRYGLVYIADEYDFALPSVTSVYQPVLEGHALVIKEAPPEWRLVKPHANFRFCATGNTNGGGDETGLYQGTQIQNAANYSRFGITVEIDYMKADEEAMVVASQGGIKEADAVKLVSFATQVRAGFSRGDISNTVSPRELINAAQLARVMGGEFRAGISLAFTNRLNATDRKAVNEYAQRIFTD